MNDIWDAVLVFVLTFPWLVPVVLFVQCLQLATFVMPEALTLFATLVLGGHYWCRTRAK